MSAGDDASTEEGNEDSIAEIHDENEGQEQGHSMSSGEAEEHSEWEVEWDMYMDQEEREKGQQVCTQRYDRHSWIREGRACMRWPGVMTSG